MMASTVDVRVASCVLVIGVIVLVTFRTEKFTPAHEPKVIPAEEYATVARPTVKKYCLDCHSAEVKKGGLDLERFAMPEDLRKHPQVWQAVIEQLEAGEMPPKDKPQPTTEERKQLLEWIRGFLSAEAKARASDPGPAPARHLNNVEYNNTIRDLFGGVDLRPANGFPADVAGGEGFLNTTDTLTDISPATLSRYQTTAKALADHAVLLPDGFRFSGSNRRPDWINEIASQLRAFYAPFANPDGRPDVPRHLATTLRHRDALLAGKITLAEVATIEKLNENYLTALWQTLTDKTPSYPLDEIRAKWRAGSEKDWPAIAAEITAWQSALWKIVPVGGYSQGQETRQRPNDPPAATAQQVRLVVKPTPGQNDITLFLSARDHAPDAKGNVVWSRPRFEGAGKLPLLLSEYAKFGPAFEVDYPSVFADSAKYLSAAVELAKDDELTAAGVAKKHGLDAAFLKRWAEVLAVELPVKEGSLGSRLVDAGEFELLNEQTGLNTAMPSIQGWQKDRGGVPQLVANFSDKVVMMPARAAGRAIMVHPSAKEHVAAVWVAPVNAMVRVQARVTHTDHRGGNGVAWRLEYRSGRRAWILGEGPIEPLGEVKLPARTFEVAKDDEIALVVDAKDGDHICDSTDISLVITETEKPQRVWDIAADMFPTGILGGNPHPDRHGNKGVWRFAYGPSRPLGKCMNPAIPTRSLLGRWHAAVSDPARKDEVAKLADEVQALLSGPQPAPDKRADRLLYDNFVSADGVLFQELDPVPLGNRLTTAFGLPKERFGKPDGASLTVPTNSVIEVKLPARLFVGREFVVDGMLDAPVDRIAQFRVFAVPPGTVKWDPKLPLVASANVPSYKRLLQGHADFRKAFPIFVCFPQVVPNDDPAGLKRWHREDDELTRLFLTAEDRRRLERLWLDHRFISRQPVVENDALPLLIGTIPPDEKERIKYYESLLPIFQKRADDFLREEEAASLKQWTTLLEFAARAYRRPLQVIERAELQAVYDALKKEAGPDAAFRAALTHVLASPAFFMRGELGPKGKEPASVSDWELATRLSYFLWSTMPDEELRTLAAAGKLRDPKVLAEQTERMIKDGRTRALAVEFGSQWLRVRGFEEFRMKKTNQYWPPNPALRHAMAEEPVQFFLDLFQNDRPVMNVIDADYVLVNSELGYLYRIPGVEGHHFRKVDGVQKFGRGGVLGFGSMLAKHTVQSRASPAIRGNWVLEVLLGEKLGPPPAKVPEVPVLEPYGTTIRQLMEKHSSDRSCAVCHARIDPFGFALEKYDSLGRLRTKGFGGVAIDAKAKTRDCSEIDGIDGLRKYLVTKKRDVVVRLFCRKLIGYALGRAVTFSDTALLDQMVAELNKNGGKVSAALQVFVKSPQFRMVRGKDYQE